MYLGAKLRKVTLPNGVEAWTMSPAKYAREAVSFVKEKLRKKGKKLVRKAIAPFANGYQPKLDVSPVLGPKDTTYFQSQIGVLQWMVEIGRIDIITEVSMLASQMAMP